MSRAAKWRGNLLIIHGRLELGDQILRTHDILSQAADQVHRPSVNQRDRKDQIVRRVLHGNIAVRRQQPLHAVKQLLPSGVKPLGAGQRIQVTGFNLVDKLGRLAFGRDQIKPAAGNHESIWQSENAVSDRVAMVMVVEEPGVDVALAQGFLDGCQVHGQRVILHDR